MPWYEKTSDLIPDIEQWPIYLFTKKRKEFIKKVIHDVQSSLENMSAFDLEQLIARTIYLEKQRIKSNPWKADPPNEMMYIRRIQKEFNESINHPDKYRLQKETAFRLVKRYTEEISGNFNANTFKFARKLGTIFFHLILFPLSWRSFFGIKRMAKRLKSALFLHGEIDTLKTLFRDHTIVLVSTHSSNMDSILIGYVLDLIGGIPAFSYGAGLNLFDSEFFAFFMNRLGAYKIDRRKKNGIYLQTLNAYSKVSMLEGINTIFFPGGTRSRSGEVERKLKLGLLNSLVLAQRILVEQNSKRKIVVFPVVLSYESVLEARSLIFEHLSNLGQEKFFARRRPSSMFQYLKLFNRLLFQGSKIYVTIGKPIDVFGNTIDKNGNSIDRKGNLVDIKNYFVVNGVLVSDSQRESIYTRVLGDRVVNEYCRNNYILPCHLAAYSAFKILERSHPNYDVFGLIQMPEDEFVFSKTAFYQLAEQVRGILRTMSYQGELIYPDMLDGNIVEIINQGIKDLGVFHIKRILKFDFFGRLISEDFMGLYFYHNKLNNLDIEEYIQWDKIPLHETFMD